MLAAHPSLNDSGSSRTAPEAAPQNFLQSLFSPYSPSSLCVVCEGELDDVRRRASTSLLLHKIRASMHPWIIEDSHFYAHAHACIHFCLHEVCKRMLAIIMIMMTSLLYVCVWVCIYSTFRRLPRIAMHTFQHSAAQCGLHEII